MKGDPIIMKKILTSKGFLISSIAAIGFLAVRFFIRQGKNAEC